MGENLPWSFTGWPIKINPSDPDVFFYTYPRRGGVITPPLVKSLFAIEEHVFSSCGEIWLKSSSFLMCITTLKPYTQF